MGLFAKLKEIKNRGLAVMAISLLISTQAQAVRDLLVANNSPTGPNGILRFNGTTGEEKGYFIQPGAGGLQMPSQMIVGPDGHLWIADRVANTIKKFNLDGEYLGDAISGASISTPVALKIGPDGKVYVLSGGTERKIHRFSAAGVYEALVVNPTSTQISNPKDFIFMPGTNDFLISSGLNSVARFNFSTGAFISHYLNPTRASAFLNTPTGIIIGPDDNYWVASSASTNKITRYLVGNVTQRTDIFTGSFVQAGHQQIVLENGYLFVANGANNNIIIYDAYVYTPSAFRVESNSVASRSLVVNDKKIDPKAKQKKPKIPLNWTRYQKTKQILEARRKPKAKKNASKANKIARMAAAANGDELEFILPGTNGLTNPRALLFVDINDPPVVNPGSNQVVGGGDPFTLSGVYSYDPEGAPLTYEWIQTSGTPAKPAPAPSPSPSATPAPAAIIGTPGSSPYVSLIAPYMPTLMNFQLTVSDGVKSRSSQVSVEVQGFEDQDNDGMPDRWETEVGLNPNLNDANLDSDGDGSKNISEFEAGTHPLNANSVLKVLQYQVVSGQFSIRFTSVPGRHYEIQSSENLTTWTTVPGLDNVVATASETTSIDTRPMVSRRFYRISVKPIGF